jgi:hypothetical protein
MLLGILLSLSAISMRTPKILVCGPSFSDVSMGDTKGCKRGACSARHEEYCDNFIQEFQPLMQFGPQISYCHFSLPPASFVDVDGRPLRRSSSTLSRPLRKRQVTHLRLCHFSLSIRLLQHAYYLRWWFLQQNAKFDILTLLSYWYFQLRRYLTQHQRNK